MKAYLTLETGDVFTGEWIGEQREVKGEVVLHTGMNGYEEILMDPSYGGQIVGFTYPLIGNCGIDATEVDRRPPQVAAVIIGEVCPHPSPFAMTETLPAWLQRHRIPGISGIDTRALATIARDSGGVRGVISDKERSPQGMTWPNPSSIHWVKQVSVKEPTSFPGEKGRPHIVVIDYGHKPSFITALRSLGCRVTVVPFDWPNERLLALGPDGLLLSNGPGDPQALLPYLEQRRSLLEGVPSFAIGLGHQAIALAFGGKTARMASGHRGRNYPVRDVETGRVWMTEQNHGYTVSKDSLDPHMWGVTHVNVNDSSVEGLRHRRWPLQSVQFHPQTGDGLFQHFLAQVNSHRKETAYA